MSRWPWIGLRRCLPSFARVRTALRIWREAEIGLTLSPRMPLCIRRMRPVVVVVYYGKLSELVMQIKQPPSCQDSNRRILDEIPATYKAPSIFSQILLLLLLLMYLGQTTLITLFLSLSSLFLFHPLSIHFSLSFPHSPSPPFIICPAL